VSLRVYCEAAILLGLRVKPKHVPAMSRLAIEKIKCARPFGQTRHNTGVMFESDIPFLVALRFLSKHEMKKCPPFVAGTVFGS
jgi:hypothetical protein